MELYDVKYIGLKEDITDPPNQVMTDEKIDPETSSNAVTFANFFGANYYSSSDMKLEISIGN